MESDRESACVSGWGEERGWVVWRSIAAWLVGAAMLAAPAAADEVFTYQGRLTEAGGPADGIYDCEFRLYSLESGGGILQTLQGSFVVSEGLLVADLSFADGTFNGNSYWLEIAIRPDGSEDPYETLAPRQPIMPAPYALFALNDGSGWTSDGINAIYNGFGAVVIGTDTPSFAAKLEISSTFPYGLLVGQHLSSPNPLTGISASTINSGTGSSVAIEGITNGDGIGVKGVSNFAGGRAMYGLTTVGHAISGQAIDPTGYASYFLGGRNYFEGPVGMGTTTPLTPLHVEGGTPNGLATGDGYAMFGPANAPNLIVDSAGLQRRNNGAASPLFLNRQGGNIIVGDANAPVNIGNGTIFPGARIDVRSEDATDLLRLANGPSASDMIMKVTAAGNVGIGTNAPTAPLEVATFASINRLSVGTTTQTFVPLLVTSDQFRAVHVEHTFADDIDTSAFYISADNPGTGWTRAIEARTSGDTDLTIVAEADGLTGKAIYAHADNTGGTAIHGHADSATGANVGVHGSTDSPSGYAGYFTGGRNYFEGNVGIGNTTPNNLFEVRANSGTAGALIENTAIGERALYCIAPQDGFAVQGFAAQGSGGAAVVGTGLEGALAGLFEGHVEMEGRFTVSRNIDVPLQWFGHVGRMENTSTSDEGDILALKSNALGGAPGNGVNFISFFNEDEMSMGAIEGDFFGGVQFAGPGADYAEWLPKFDPNEEIQPGDVVGVVEGEISRRTEHAQQVMVISTQPIVVGNRPREDDGGDIDGWEKVAFIGQAPVRVRGPVEAGDFIVPSGRNDGVAIAISPQSVHPAQLDQIIGAAWESSASDGVELITCAIGIGELPAAARAMESMRQSMQRQQETIDDLLDRVRTLERLVGAPGVTE